MSGEKRDVVGLYEDTDAIIAGLEGVKLRLLETGASEGQVYWVREAQESLKGMYMDLKALSTALTKMAEDRAAWEGALNIVVDALKLNHERTTERLRALLEKREGKA